MIPSSPSRESPGQEQFDVFISYSRKDIQFARLVESALRHSASPEIRVFRDEEKISGNEYYRTIERCLRQSRKLLLIASPPAYGSQFVNDEVRDFIRIKGSNDIIVILMAGIPNHEARAGEEREKAFPETLCEVMRMPLAADYRGFDATVDRLDEGRYRHEWRKVLEQVNHSPSYEWDIFIGYAREQAGFARHLERELERYRPPRALGLPSRHLKVFSEEDDATPEDRRKIDTALLESRKMILLCSPQARNDERVRSQVRRFAGAQGAERIIPLLLAGAVDGQASDLAFPEELLEWVGVPSYADYRAFSTGMNQVNGGAFRGNWYSLLSTYYEIRRDDLEMRERKRIVRRRSILGMIAITIIAALSLALVLTIQARNEAEARLRLAEARRYNSSMQLAEREFAGGDRRRGYELLESYLDDPFSSPMRSFFWYYLWRQNHLETATIRRNLKSIGALAFAPNGKVLATGDDDGHVVLWDQETQRQIGSLCHSCDRTEPLLPKYLGHWEEAMVDYISQISFSPDGHYLVTASYLSKIAKLWEVESRKEVQSFPGAYLAAFTPDGHQLILGMGVEIQLWKIDKHQSVSLGSDYECIQYTSLAVSREGGTLIATCMYGPSRAWDLETKDRLELFKSDDFVKFIFSPDGRTLIGLANNQEVRLIEAGTGRVTASLKSATGSTPPWDIALSSDGRILAATSGGETIRLWDLVQRRELNPLKGHTGAVQEIAFSPDQYKLASCANDGSVKLWDLGGLDAHSVILKDAEAMSLQKEIPAGLFDSIIVNTEVSPDRQWLAVERLDGSKKTFSLANWKGYDLLNGAMAMALSIDEKKLAMIDQEGKPWIWDIAGRPLSVPLELSRSQQRFSTVRFSPDGRLLGFGGDRGELVLMDISKGSVSQRLPGLTSTVTAIAFSPDGRTLAGGTDHGVVKLWDLASFQEMATLESPVTIDGSSKMQIMGLIFSMDGRCLIGISDEGKVLFYRAASDEEIKQQRT